MTISGRRRERAEQADGHSKCRVEALIHDRNCGPPGLGASNVDTIPDGNNKSARPCWD